MRDQLEGEKKQYFTTISTNKSTKND